MTFTELCSLYEVYKNMYMKTQAPAQPTPAPAQPTPAPASTPAQPTPAPASTPALAQPTPVTNNDLMAMLQAMQIPTVRGEAPKPESIDDVICRIAGIETPKTDKK